MDCVISVGVSILGKIGEYTVAPVGHQLGYLFKYKRNLTNLQTQIQQLRNAENRLQHAVDEATRDAEGIEDDVQEWLCKVRQTITKAEGFIQLQGESNAGHCNFMSRYQLSRKASKMVGEIHQLKEDQVTRFNKVSYRPTLQSAFKNKLYMEFESRKETFNGIMEALRDPKLSMVIVCGPGGIGKTLLAREVARRTLGEKMFSTVIMVTISQDIDVKKVQKEIAEKLGLTLEESSLSARAERIQRRLEQEKEILLILDDVWVKFELADVGISFEDDQKGCKILVTSRFQHLSFDDHLNATKNFQIRFLSYNEATNLFNKIAGGSEEQPDFKVLALKIIEECSGLPIAITTVASALRNKSMAVWNDALRQLRSNTIVDILGMDASVYKGVKLSYDFLRSEEAQLLLLFCSLRGEDSGSDIKFLLKYAMGWSLFQGAYKLEEARDRVFALTYELQARYLLFIDEYYRDCARMHDIIRDVVMSIASKEKKMHHIRYTTELRHFSSNNTLEDSVVIFVCDKPGDEQLPEQLKCPNLKFLFVDNRSVPDQFFEETRNLRVLDLNRVPIERLPSSICALQGLRTLCMWGCSCLRDIASIGELKSLELLTIASCNIKMVPKEIGQLTGLRSLDLNNCYQLRTIESDVISKLTKLEELNLENDRIHWEFERVDGESSNASLTEVKNLAELTTLNLQIEDANILPRDFFTDKLERYQISIGHNFDDGDLEKYKWDTWPTKRMLQLCLSEGELPKEKGLEVLLKNSQLLYLDGLEDVSNFAYELGTEGFQQLKYLVLQESNRIQHVVNSVEQTHPCTAFQSLELLILRGMMKLEKICHGELTPESFAMLQVIKVNSCDKLRNLFHYSVAKCLSRLETIQVTDCKMLEEIVINEGQIIGSEIIFPQLRSLELKNVPKLSHFISELHPPQRSTLPLFCGKLADPTSFMKLRELVVEDCSSLKRLFSSSVAENLLQLNRLEIRNCNQLEEAVATNQRMDKLLFPQLYFVMLNNLPKLTRLCSGAVLECPRLVELQMKGCPQLTSSVSISEHEHLS